MVTIVLGMHRSGTSMLTGSLEEAGLFFGENLPTENVGNAKGNREDNFLNHLHENVLKFNKGSWFRPPYRCKWNGFHKRILGYYIEHMNANYDSWGFKDPRTILVLNQWINTIENHQFVAIFRHPILVAQSLRERNNFTIQHGLDLWTHYNRILLHYIKKNQIPLIEFTSDYESLLNSLQLLLTQLELPNRNIEFDFLVKDLYNKIEEPIKIPPGPRQLYHNLLKHAIS